MLSGHVDGSLVTCLIIEAARAKVNDLHTQTTSVGS
jgi:hypothetical protein